MNTLFESNGTRRVFLGMNQICTEDSVKGSVSGNCLIPQDHFSDVTLIFYTLRGSNVRIHVEYSSDT
jgi:hypothetical protein